MNPQDKKKMLVNSIMGNKKLSSIFFDAVNAPVGSTKKDRAKSILSILSKTNPVGSFSGMGGPGFDGQGGPGDAPGNFFSNAGSAIGNFQNSNPNASTPPQTPQSPQTPTDPNAQNSGVLTPPVNSSVHIFPAAPEFNQTNPTPPSSGNSVSNAISQFQSSKPAEPTPTPQPPTPPYASQPWSMTGPHPWSPSDKTTPPVAPPDTSTQGNVSITTPVDSTNTDTSSGSPSTNTPTDTSSKGSSTMMSGSGLSGGAAHNIATNIPGMTNITMPFSQAITQFGLNTLIDGFIANEGKNAAGTKLNNPGDIKILSNGLLPGQSHSGIFATDGGEFAAYATRADGRKAIGDILMGAAAGNGPYGTGPDGKNPSFEFVANKYTNTGTTGQANNTSGTSDTQNTTGNSVYLKDVYDGLNASLASGMTSSDAANQYMAGISASTGNDPNIVFLARENLTMLGSKMDQLNTMAPELPTYLENYATNHDNLINSVNVFEKGIQNTLLTGVGLTTDNIKAYTDSLTFLENVKASQSANYLKYINKGIAQFNTNLSTVTTEYNKAQTLFDTVVSQGSEVTPTTYENTLKVLQMTSSYLDKAPGVLQSQLAAESASTNTNLSTITSMIDSSKAIKIYTPGYLDKAAAAYLGTGSDRTSPDFALLPIYMQGFMGNQPQVQQTYTDALGNTAQKNYPFWDVMKPLLTTAQEAGTGSQQALQLISQIQWYVNNNKISLDVGNYFLKQIPGGPTMVAPPNPLTSMAPVIPPPQPKPGFWGKAGSYLSNLANGFRNSSQNNTPPVTPTVTPDPNAQNSGALTPPGDTTNTDTNVAPN